MAEEFVNKRSRGVNFSVFEKELLIELVSRNKNVLECKRTDGVRIKEKDVTWEKLRNDFNSHAHVTVRTTKQLRQFYTNIKRSTKKAKGEERVARYKTGGGPFTTSKVDESVLALIEDQIIPNSNRFDCDAEYHGDSENITEEDPTTQGEDPTTQEEEPTPYHFEIVSIVHEDILDTSQGKENISQSSTPTTKGRVGAAATNNKQLSRSSKASLCRDNIAALAENRATLCEKEIKLMDEKYTYEVKLLQMKMENERLRMESEKTRIECMQKKSLYYDEKLRRLGKDS